MYICRTNNWNLYHINDSKVERPYINVNKGIKREFKKFEVILNKLSETYENPTTQDFVFKDLLPLNQIKSVSIQLDPPLKAPMKIHKSSEAMSSHIIESIFNMAIEYSREKGFSLEEMLLKENGDYNLKDQTENIKHFSKTFLTIWKKLYPDESTLKVAQYLHELFTLCFDSRIRHYNTIPQEDTIRSWIKS